MATLSVFFLVLKQGEERDLKLFIRSVSNSIIGE